MTQPRMVPPPPNYPPTVGAPAPRPTVIAVTPEKVTETTTGLLTGRRPVYNATAVLAALAPVFGGYSAATGLGVALHDCRTTQSLGGAWAIAGGALVIALYLDRTRQGWHHRALLAAAVLGTVLSMPWLDAVLVLMTGVHR